MKAKQGQSPGVGKKRRSRHRFREIPSLDHARPVRLERNSTLPTNDLFSEASLNLSASNSVSDRVTEEPNTGDVERHQSGPYNVEFCPEDDDASDTSEGSHNSLDVSGTNPESAEEIMDLTGYSGNEIYPSNLVHPRTTSSLQLRKWQALWGILMTSGSRRISKRHYQSMRVVADTFGRIGLSSWRKASTNSGTIDFENRTITSLPHFSTVYRALRPIVHNELGPRALEFFERVDMRKAGARFQQYSSQGDPQTKVRIIVPSEYARADMSTGPVFQQMCTTSLENSGIQGQRSGIPVPAVAAMECVDIWPVIAARDWFYGPSRWFSVDFDRVTKPISNFAEKGDIVKVSVLGTVYTSGELGDYFNASKDASQSHTVEGTVSHVWNVHHANRRHDLDFIDSSAEMLPEKEREIISRLQYVSYCSPSDSVTVEVPQLPVENSEGEGTDTERGNPLKKKKQTPEVAEALRKRRAALKEKKRQTEIAWMDWVKPLIKPGDTVALLRSSFSTCQAPESSSSPEVSTNAPLVVQTSYLCLVHRFWTENEEHNRHIFWIASQNNCSTRARGDSQYIRRLCRPLDDGDVRLYRDVRKVVLVAKHAGNRGPERSTPVSSTGTLLNGEKYFVYRFILFWDGFEISEGKSASGEGFYLACLNLPIRARSSASAVRVITLTPPGVKSASVFKRIQEDIVVGMTDGYVDYDANGDRRRIFLDLVGYIGDTPALNSNLDVMGHTARCCCHLCRFHRHSTTVVGSRYTQPGFHGLCAPFSRNFYVHTAVRDAGAGQETCMLLGMKLSAEEVDLPMHSMFCAMREARASIPLTSSGIPVLPGVIDPYKACFVAPDHLLTGHARDCVNTAFKLLPSKQHRILSETYMMSLLADCKLPVQTRLFDHKQAKLHQMSMTELYALILVAPQGFMAGCAKADSDISNLHPRCLEAISVVFSCAKLIAELWYMPDANCDGPLAVQLFNDDNGSTNVFLMQKMVSEHLCKVQALCAITGEEEVIEKTSRTKATASRISKDHSLAIRAIKTLDKPNLHRLQELAFCTLPMIGHVARIGELVLEKAHQPLKQTIKSSNNKDPQLTSIKTISVNDWQGRLTLLVPNALKNDIGALRGCFRLLAGREAVISIRARLTPDDTSDVLRALGPDLCVPAELHSQAQSVISPRSLALDGVLWIPKANIEVLRDQIPLSSQHRQQTLLLLQKARITELKISDIQFFDSVVSVHSNGLRGPAFHKGDVIDMLCYKPLDFQFHVPFVIRTNTISDAHDRRVESGVSLWCIATLFNNTGEKNSPELYASVFPCRKKSRLRRDPGFSDTYDKYCVTEQLSIAKINTCVRRVAVIHDCNPTTCVPASSKPRIEHEHKQTWTPLNGGDFQVRTRKDGYPPRQG